MVISALVNFQVATVLLSCMAAPLNQRHQKVHYTSDYNQDPINLILYILSPWNIRDSFLLKNVKTLPAISTLTASQ